MPTITVSKIVARATAALVASVLVAATSNVPGHAASDTAGIRMMLKVQIPAQSGNTAIEAGNQAKIFENLMDRIKPEAAYFTQEDGLRTAYFVYIVHDTAEFAAVHEPLIQGFGALVYDQPALTWDELKAGFGDIGERP
jgi:hypothetical protein